MCAKAEFNNQFINEACDETFKESAAISLLRWKSSSRRADKVSSA
jgi:hypothetical protein